MSLRGVPSHDEGEQPPSEQPTPRRLGLASATRLDDGLADDDAPTQRGPEGFVQPGDHPDRLPVIDRDTYVIAGKFAQGGIGRILRAHDPVLDRPVALKELLVHGRSVDEERFVREVLLTARLQHPGIVPVYAAGRWPSGEPFYAMKLVSGRSFDKVLAEAHTLAARLALLPHVLAIAETVAYAHSQRIIHRDLKPHNVLVGAFGETVVIDWGLAKELDVPDDPIPPSDHPPPDAVLGHSSSTAHPSRDLTHVGAVVGTPGYMSPEQADGAAVDCRTDVYALGAILYHMLTGSLAYDASNPINMVYKTVYEDHVPLLTREPEAPDELAAIVEKAMHRDPQRRYPSAKEFADDLRRFQTGQIVGAHRYTAWERLRRFARKHRTALGFAAVSLVLIVVVTAISFAEVRQQRDAAEEARADAVAAEQLAHAAQTEAERRADNLSFEQARLLVDADPSEALRLLHGVSPQADWRRTRQLAAELDQRGLPVVLHGHRAAISRAAFSPDGAALATTSDDCTLRVWDLSSRTSRAFYGHTSDVWRAAWSPDQTRIATSSRDGTVRVWDLRDGGVQVLAGHTRGARNVAFTPDGRFVYVGDDDRALRRWDLATTTGTVLDRCEANTIPWTANFVACIASSSDEIYLHDLRTGERTVVRAPAGINLQHSGGLSPDGRYVASSTEDGGVWLYDARAGTGRALQWPPSPVPIVGRSLREIRFSPASDQLAAPASAGPLRHYDLVRDRGVHLTPHDGYTRRASFSPDGRLLASVGGDTTVAVYEVATATTYPMVASAHMLDAQFSPDGRWLAAVGNDPRVFLWSTSIFAREQWIPPIALAEPAFAVARDAPTVLMLADQPYRVDLDRMQGAPLPDSLRALKRVALAGDGATAVGVDERDELLVFSLPRGDVLVRRSLGPGCLGPLRVTVDPDRPRWILNCEDTRVLLVDPAAGEPLRELARVPDNPPALFFRGRDAFLLPSDEHELLRFADSAAAPQPIARFQQRISNLVALPDADEFVAAAEDGVEHLDLAGRRLGELLGHRLQVNQLGVSADGRVIFTASRDNVVRLFDRRTHEPLLELPIPDLLDRNGALSPDGTRIAVAVAGGDVLVWDLGERPDEATRRREYRRLRGQESVTSLHFEADSRSLIAVTTTGRVVRWRDPLPDDPEGLREWIAANVDPIGRPKSALGCAVPE